MLSEVCEWTVIAFNKNHWILSIHSNFIQILLTKMYVGFTLVGPPSMCLFHCRLLEFEWLVLYFCYWLLIILHVIYYCIWSQCSTAVRTVVRATQQVNGKWPYSGCQNSVTPEPIDYKFDARDYLGELTSCAKFHKIRRLKGWPAIWWNIHLAYFFIYFFSRRFLGKLYRKKYSTISSA